jgi:uncharacterized membrane protein YebE (DUF533 family)
MFDARSILDILLGGPGGRPREGRQPDSTVFKDMLDQLGDQQPMGQQNVPQPARDPQSQPGGTSAQRAPQGVPSGFPGGGPGGGMSLEDLLRTILTGGAPPQGEAQPAGGEAAPGNPQGPAATPEVSVELQDLLRRILQGGNGQGGGQGQGGGSTRIPVNRVMGNGASASRRGQDGAEGGAASLGEALKELLGQAVAGTREGAARLDEATGVSDRARETLGQATGQSPEELIATIRQLVADNRLAAGAALGGLGALVLGTGAGRSLAGTALRLGSLALIGGLAYKAVQNYQQGRPILSSSRSGERQALAPAPEGSGFEPGAVTDDAAKRYIRAMIAAAAADGRIDAAEQQRILGGLRQAGLEDAAQQFLAAEIVSPANVAELAAGVTSPEEAVQIYTAARIAVDPDTGVENAFLSSLAETLGIDDELAAQVDSAARAAA